MITMYSQCLVLFSTDAPLYKENQTDNISKRHQNQEHMILIAYC